MLVQEWYCANSRERERYIHIYNSFRVCLTRIIILFLRNFKRLLKWYSSCIYKNIARKQCHTMHTQESCVD